MLLSLAGALAVWQAWSTVGRRGLEPPAIPPPLDVLRAYRDWLASGLLVRDLWASAFLGMIGFVLGASLGVALGLLTARAKRSEVILGPILSALRPIPPIAVVPLVVAAFGIGLGPRIVLVAAAALIATWFLVHEKVRHLDPRYDQTASLLGLSQRRRLTDIIIPASAGDLLIAARNGANIAFFSLIAAELAGSGAGLAYRIEQAHAARDTPQMMAAIAALGLVGFGVDLCFNAATSRLTTAAVPRKRRGDLE